jgi:Na+-driven multidrug efflux pump
MFNLVISFWFFAIPVGVFLAFNGYTGIPNEADGMWIGMIAGLSLSAILNLRRLKQKKNELKKLF